MNTKSSCAIIICCSAAFGVLLSTNHSCEAFAQKIPLGRREYKGIWLMSLTRVLAVPSDVHLKQISVAGVLRTTNESTALFLDSESFKHGITENAIWVDFSRLDVEERKKIESENGNWARVIGIFDGETGGAFALYSGGIVASKITLIAN
jgi:hypothetical protein